MANSSQSGNILGYASGTQPGLVSTVAQTFAGDKTLSGLITASGGILNTGLTGSNATTAFTAGSGKVGEYKTASPASNVTPLGSGTATTVTSFSGASILTPGIWLIFGTVGFTKGTVVGNTELRGLISGSSNSNVTYTGNLDASGDTPTLATIAISQPHVKIGPIVINISVNTSIYLNGQVDYSSLGTAVFRTDSVLSALRIA